MVRSVTAWTLGNNRSSILPKPPLPHRFYAPKPPMGQAITTCFSDSVLIKKGGKTVAALVNAQLFERIRRMEARFEALSQRLEKGFSSIPEDDGMVEIEQITKDSRQDGGCL